MYDIFIIFTWVIGVLAYGSWVTWTLKQVAFAWAHDTDVEWPAWMLTRYGSFTDKAIISYVLPLPIVFIGGFLWPILWLTIAACSYFYWWREQVRKTKSQRSTTHES